MSILKGTPHVLNIQKESMICAELKFAGAPVPNDILSFVFISWCANLGVCGCLVICQQCPVTISQSPNRTS